MEQRSLHPIAVPARRNSSGSCQREQKNRRNKNEEPITAYHNEYIIFGDCDSGADTIRESTKYCLPHGSDQQCTHVRTAVPLNFSFYPSGGGYTPLPRISRRGALPNGVQGDCACVCVCVRVCDQWLNVVSSLLSCGCANARRLTARGHLGRDGGVITKKNEGRGLRECF